MNDIYRLRDIDNRDDSGAPWETTGTLAELAEYIDGPVRGDITDIRDIDLDQVVARMRSGELPERELRALSIYVSPIEGETP